jgi:FPC/CPF motif-containing protein YcgG
MTLTIKYSDDCLARIAAHVGKQLSLVDKDEQPRPATSEEVADYFASKIESEVTNFECAEAARSFQAQPLKTL